MNSLRTQPVTAGKRFRTQWIRASLALALVGCAPLALAQSMAPAAAGAPTPVVKIDGAKLVEMLVANGVITREQANELIRAASTEEPAAASGAAGVVAQSPATPGVQTIPYVPAPVRKQIKEELRAEVMQQAKEEGWAA